MVKHGYVELNNDTASNVALDVIQKQFEANGRVIPIEDGIYLSDDEEIIVDPKSFTHPLEIKINE